MACHLRAEISSPIYVDTTVSAVILAPKHGPRGPTSRRSYDLVRTHPHCFVFRGLPSTATATFYTFDLRNLIGDVHVLVLTTMALPQPCPTEMPAHSEHPPACFASSSIANADYPPLPSHRNPGCVTGRLQIRVYFRRQTFMDQSLLFSVCQDPERCRKDHTLGDIIWIVTATKSESGIASCRDAAE